ncbi:MAG: hypothetical protein CMJ58_28760 [Planctomycetaceae bacterium]|nr:hypothetical protein [Planctomycetaceae bacterium]
MKRFPTFLLGMFVGCGLLWTALNYHLIKARDGLHLVKKTQVTLADTYLDARQMSPRDWLQHANAAEAVLRSENQQLIDSVMTGTVDNALDRIFPGANQSPPAGN